MHTLKDLVDECERIKWTEMLPNYDNSNNNNTKKDQKKLRNLKQQRKMAVAKMNWQQTGTMRTSAPANFAFNCHCCGPNGLHNTEKCFK